MFGEIDANHSSKWCDVQLGVWQCVVGCCSVLQCAAACCNVLQCVAVCCSVLQRVPTQVCHSSI